MGNICPRYLSTDSDESPSSGVEDLQKGARNVRNPSQNSNFPPNIEGIAHEVPAITITKTVAMNDDTASPIRPSSGGGASTINHPSSGDPKLYTSHGNERGSGVRGQTDSELMRVNIETSQPTLAAFQSLVERSIAAWHTIKYVGPERVREEQIAVINENALRLRSYHSLEGVLKRRGYWFFQLRESFMRQKVFLKWDPTHLHEYILLPVSYGFVNNQDCFFVSHYWLTRDHPDPDAVDLVQIQEDLKAQEWSYVWVDWTCVPQLPRTELEQAYFNRMLRYIHMLVRDCGFEWRFPAFEPRGWILYEVAEYVFSHKSFTWTDDNRPFINHCSQMLKDGVRAVIDKYGYRCARQGDLDLLVGSLELQVLLVKILPDVGGRQQIRDRLDEPYVGTVTDYGTGMKVDKVEGVISYQGRTYHFTPVFQLTSDM